MNEENLQILRDACIKAGIQDARQNEQGNFVAILDGVEIKTTIRVIEDVDGGLIARIVKDKKGNVSEVVICNVPRVEDIINLEHDVNKVVSEYVNKYFLTNYVRKLINNPSITKIVDLLTPQSGNSMTANPLSKPFNAIVKIVASGLKTKCPSKAKLITEQAVKLFLIEEQACNLTLGQVTVKDKTINAYDFIVAVIKQQLNKVEEYKEFSLDDVINYATELATKAKDKEMTSNIDEDDLDI